MKTHRWTLYLDFLLRLVIGLLFLVAVFTKVLDVEYLIAKVSGGVPSSGHSHPWRFDHFLQSISDFGIVHESLLMPTALALLVAETVGAFALIFRLRWGLYVIAGLLIVFVGVLGYGLWIGLEIDCGCFGIDTQRWTGPGLWPALGRNIVLLIGCLFLFWRQEIWTKQQNGKKQEDRPCDNSSP